MSETFLDGKVTLLRGDCLELLPTLEANSIDSCVTDPPYHLTAQGGGRSNLERDPDTIPKSAGTRYNRVARGFMGKQWDGGDIAFRAELWAEVFRVLKPGAHLLAFSGTRTYHRMACAIEDAGFEIRDQIGWCYGSGFPKSHDISKAIDRLNGVEREIVGQRISEGGRSGSQNSVGAHLTVAGKLIDITAPATDAAIQWQGWGTALKPAWEPIVLARKPLSESSIAANVLKHGTGAINIDGCRVSTGEDCRRNAAGGNNGLHGSSTFKIRERRADEKPQAAGRWPANLIHDGSEEVVSGFPDSDGQQGALRGTEPSGTFSKVSSGPLTRLPFEVRGDSGSAARFFYTAKADADDRLGSRHPTVKPLDLMQYLVRLVTPDGGIVLDPFAGTGTTGEAVFRERFKAILIEREPEYQADIVKRMGLCLAGPDERRAKSVKQVGVEDTPLFGGVA